MAVSSLHVHNEALIRYPPGNQFRMHPLPETLVAEQRKAGDFRVFLALPGQSFSRLLLAALASGLLFAVAPARVLAAGFQVSPPKLVLEGNYARAQLLATAVGPDGSVNERSNDLTHAATYASSNPQVVTVSSSGFVLATGNGEAVISVTAGAETVQTPVTVSGVLPQPVIAFKTQVLPVLTKAGCNSGPCHASQYGKGGFKLSVFSFAPEEDYQAIVRDRRQRRVNMLDPEHSLFLQKPTLEVPHGGNRRLTAGSIDYELLKNWLIRGAQGPKADEPKVQSVKVIPPRRVGPVGMMQQLQVLATYTDGKTRDVTCWAKFDSLDDSVVTVTEDGRFTTAGKGQSNVMVRFEGQAEIATVVVPYADNFELVDWKENNFIDALAAKKFRELGLPPSPLCDDATFVRRAFLDAIGTLPTIEETKTFIDSTDPDKRKKLIDSLLGLTGDPAKDIYNNQYAAYWTLKWADLIRSNSKVIGEQGMWALHNWIGESLRQNKPFDQFVRELITAKGSIYRDGPANYFRVANNPQDLCETTSQLFLGVRMQCAKCHHHPYRKIRAGRLLQLCRLLRPSRHQERARSSACSVASKWSWSAMAATSGIRAPAR